MSKHTASLLDMNPDQLTLAGGKGGSLAKLIQSGYPVPAGFVILPSAFAGEGLISQAQQEVEERIASLRRSDPEISFAVRSSALSEDSSSASFAGEYETWLNVRQDSDILRAIQSVYQSRTSERVQAYSQIKGKNGWGEIAVVLQKLVNAESSGVLFTAHPITGRRDQAMITAAWGLGEAIVGGMVTPDILVIDKQSGRILTREIADKQVMTVLLDQGTKERPVPDQKRRSPVLSEAQVAQLLELGVRIERDYGMPMDIEWVSASKEIMIVQARPITTLPGPRPSAPTAWKLPRGQYAAMRNNIVELMPNPLTPLFDTLGREAINASMGRLLTFFLGKPGILPGETIISVNGYAYYNGSVRPLKAMGMVFDMVGILKRMFTGAVERWTVAGRPHYMETIECLRARPVSEVPATELLAATRKLAEAAIDAYGTLISGLIPAAWMSEALFTRFYNAFIKRRGDPAAQTFLLGFDSVPIRAEKSLYDLATWARTHPKIATSLSDTPARQQAAWLEDGSTPSGAGAGDWHAWQNRFQAHVVQYGHAIYDLDFANPVPADDPTPLLETVQMFLRGQGTNPYSRQRAAVEKRDQAQQAVEKRVKGLRLRTYRKLLVLAQRFAPLREDGLADIGLGYPLLRQILRELGSRLVAGGLIPTPDDIYWLTKDEVMQAAARLESGQALTRCGDIITQRKALHRAARQATPPLILPQMKLFGVDLAELKSGRARKQKGNLVKGVAASPGVVTGPACVLHDIEEFDLMKPGDVLVATITTPAWTPLFARAAGIVTDVGGPLSHGSIVAREYGIPAVLGTSVATQRIHSGQMITVDGSRGLVHLGTSDTCTMEKSALRPLHSRSK